MAASHGPYTRPDPVSFELIWFFRFLSCSWILISFIVYILCLDLCSEFHSDPTKERIIDVLRAEYNVLENLLYNRYGQKFPYYKVAIPLYSVSWIFGTSTLNYNLFVNHISIFILSLN
jgi:hypothetical protein